MNAPLPLSLDSLPTAAASAVKKDGWRGMMRVLQAQGKLLITNHNQPEAVILSTAEYTRLVQAAQAANHATLDPLAELRRQFDERLASLHTADAAERLRNVMRSPARLGGKVRAGSTY